MISLQQLIDQTHQREVNLVLCCDSLLGAWSLSKPWCRLPLSACISLTLYPHSSGSLLPVAPLSRGLFIWGPVGWASPLVGWRYYGSWPSPSSSACRYVILWLASPWITHACCCGGCLGAGLLVFAPEWPQVVQGASKQSPRLDL
jgi:hypothetical protein